MSIEIRPLNKDYDYRIPKKENYPAREISKDLWSCIRNTISE